MDDSPATAIRRKRNSSMVIGINLIKKKRPDAFVSAGNTGGMVCAGVLGLDLIEGVQRPGIGTIFPSLKGPIMLLDAGANIEAKPEHLLQYGVMASVYSEIVLEKKNPTVGLLNIGEEESKGSDFLKETYALMKAKLPNFIGNIEGKHMFKGECDCVICDGLVGNITLKVSEGLAETIEYFLKKEIKSNWLSLIGVPFIIGAMKNFKRKVDYSEYGGAALLGVNGVVIISHGSSNAKAIKNAIRVAAAELKRDINHEIKDRINQVGLVVK